MVRYAVLDGLYEIGKTIGCGGFAKVKLATHLATGEKVAIKIMDKKLLGEDLHRVTRELHALKNLQHGNICQLYQVLESESHFFIVMEYCSGGELFDHIVEKKRLTESESRTFFGQIVSAVAYLHSMGYAHRDLKPENVLLDKNQKLKLIDFGLCAKPDGGIENPLKTSCGSPMYAAPELILGQQYLGHEVDVWAMGVLLFALLTGSLPFDDSVIDNLYKKILNGSYEEPKFISRDGRMLIKSMLQVEPRKRINIGQILEHPWLTLGVFKPISHEHKSHKVLDQECIQVMADFLEIPLATLKTELAEWKYDYNTVTYYLLLQKKRNGQSLKLNRTIGWRKPDGECVPLTEISNNTKQQNLTPVDRTRVRRKFGKVSRSPAYGQFLEPHSGRTALKRPRSPTLLDHASPVPSKKAPAPSTETPSSKTPDRRNVNVGTSASANETPISARRMLIGSIEKSLNKVRHVLTPKKASEMTSSLPAVLNEKDLCNVSTTQYTDPETVMTELSKSLEEKGIRCTRKGFALKGSMDSSRLGGCSFELEICYLPSNFMAKQQRKPIGENEDKLENFIGIRRKRLKGDSWCYKKVCEQVLALTSTGFTQKNVRESAV
ncbi:hypothetical protein ABEB36_000423 [Hypothenemus hampei]|uniref:non-specific serine/threonine protein kinase n=1 Tax=Hypothenemus hampei TaxID=57062 RepID=A0ABD1FBW0_HYPHA